VSNFVVMTTPSKYRFQFRCQFAAKSHNKNIGLFLLHILVQVPVLVQFLVESPNTDLLLCDLLLTTHD